MCALLHTLFHIATHRPIVSITVEVIFRQIESRVHSTVCKCTKLHSLHTAVTDVRAIQQKVQLRTINHQRQFNGFSWYYNMCMYVCTYLCVHYIVVDTTMDASY